LESRELCLTTSKNFFIARKYKGGTSQRCYLESYSCPLNVEHLERMELSYFLG
jgi:hypothetical protein